MAITLETTAGGVTLPDGLRFSDELDWTPIVQSTQYTLTGALVVEQATRQAGRPITLVGGRNWAWLTRAQALALQALLEAGEEMTLTLHDARTFTVLPANEGALTLTALPIVRDSGPANPSLTATYVLETLKLIEV